MAFSVHSLMHSSNICFVRLCAKPRLGHGAPLEEGEVEVSLPAALSCSNRGKQMVLG